MKRLQDSSIRAKLILLGTLTAGIALILACIMFVMNDVSATKDAMVQHLNTLADVLGGNCVAALTFNDSKAANDVLASLRFEPTIHVAIVYDRQGHPFATYKSEAGGVAMPASQAVAEPGHVFRRDGTLQIVASIRDNNEAVGTVVLNAGMGQVDAVPPADADGDRRPDRVAGAVVSPRVPAPKVRVLTHHKPGDDRRAHFTKPRLLDPRRESGK